MLASGLAWLDTAMSVGEHMSEKDRACPLCWAEIDVQVETCSPSLGAETGASGHATLVATSYFQ